MTAPYYPNRMKQLVTLLLGEPISSHSREQVLAGDRTGFWRYMKINRQGEIIETSNIASEINEFLHEQDRKKLVSRSPAFYKWQQTLIVTFVPHTSRDQCWLLQLDPEDTRKILQKNCSTDRISRSEILVLHDLLAGKTIRQSALEADVAYETRRSQLKSLHSKLQINSQNELVRTSTLSLIDATLMNISNIEKPVDDGRDFARDFFFSQYGDRVRYFEVTLEGNGPIRCAEAGSPEGKPVLFLHGNILPPLTGAFFDALEARGTRLIMPLRDGFLTNKKEFIPTDRQVRRHSKQIAKLSLLLGLGPLHVTSYGTGAAYALDLALRKEVQIASIQFAASSYFLSAGDSAANHFMRGVKDFALESERLLHSFILLYDRLLGSDDKLLKTLRNTYLHSAEDSRIIGRMISHSPGRRFLTESYRSSLSSLSVDWRLARHNIWSRLNQLDMPVTLIHGTEDPLNEIGMAEKIAGTSANCTLVSVPHHGQFLAHDGKSPLIDYLPGIEKAE